MAPEFLSNDIAFTFNRRVSSKDLRLSPSELRCRNPGLQFPYCPIHKRKKQPVGCLRDNQAYLTLKRQVGLSVVPPLPSSAMIFRVGLTPFRLLGTKVPGLLLRQQGALVKGEFYCWPRAEAVAENVSPSLDLRLASR